MRKKSSEPVFLLAPKRLLIPAQGGRYAEYTGPYTTTVYKQ
jgi:hypothetical protein